MDSIQETAPLAPSRASTPLSRARDYNELSKPRVTSLVIATTAAGMVIGANAEHPLTLPLFLSAIAGSWLVVGSANAFNQVSEAEPDSKMRRTAKRPIPAGRLSKAEAATAGMVWGIAGVLLLAVLVNDLTALLAAASILLYVFGYTPLKKRSHICTVVGAIAGAIPPLAGWVAVRNELGPQGVLLFAIQFIWQFPHFWAIAWLNREDYQHAGFKMLPFPDASGTQTGFCAFQYTLPLFPLVLIFTSGATRPYFYLPAALLLCLWMLSSAITLWKAPSDETARKVLKTSVMFLPLLLLLMIFNS